jgi:hypothetical protein
MEPIADGHLMLTRGAVDTTRTRSALPAPRRRQHTFHGRKVPVRHEGPPLPKSWGDKADLISVQSGSAVAGPVFHVVITGSL